MLNLIESLRDLKRKIGKNDEGILFLPLSVEEIDINDENLLNLPYKIKCFTCENSESESLELVNCEKCSEEIHNDLECGEVYENGFYCKKCYDIENPIIFCNHCDFFFRKDKWEDFLVFCDICDNGVCIDCSSKCYICNDFKCIDCVNKFKVYNILPNLEEEDYINIYPLNIITKNKFICESCEEGFIIKNDYNKFLYKSSKDKKCFEN